MINKKRVVIVFLFFILGLVISLNAYADEVGCCTNPGAGSLTCSTERLALRDKECCPKPELSFPAYYKSPQNPDSPLNSNDCTTNFFFVSKACSSVNACALGCCCSQLGGQILPEAQCKGTGLTFHKGQTNCNLLCPVPECNDGLNNDPENNNCADFEGGDTGCTSPTDTSEEGGSCLQEGAGCNNPSYVPKLSNLVVTPVKGQRKLLLSWQDECRETAASYEVLRCKESGCTNFVLIGTTSANSFEDISEDLLFDTIYTYQIKARYNLQAATPTITKTAILGNIECLEQQSSNNFCIHESYYEKYKSYLSTNFAQTFSKNFAEGVKTQFGDKLNKAFFCDTFNKLIPEGTACASTQVCVVTNNRPSCLNKVNCNYNAANPFGLYYTLEGCETDRYCFYDRSHSTIDSCFGCNPSMECYDYKTEAACSRDNCNLGSCIWKNLENQIGTGACVSKAKYNCQWCEGKGTKSLENIKSFNEVFDFCTREKSNLLSEGSFKCYFRNGKSKDCNNVVCTDYEASQCSNSQITHDENNKINNPSSDECGIKVCQNINNICVKNADGDSKADCSSVACESDYFAPNTTLTPLIKKGLIDSLIIQIYDKTSVNSSVILKTSSDYATFLCAEPCGSSGHPYSSSTPSRTVIISNLNAFDGTNGKKLLDLNEGINTLRYYSQDPAKNIENIKKITIETHSKTSGPKVLSVNISGSSKVLDKIYTNNQQPIIEISFFEPAIVTFARLVDKKSGLIVTLQGNTELSAKVNLPVAQVLPNAEYTLELNAKSKDKIFMDPPLSQVIVVDNSKPTLSIIPSNDEVINTSFVTVELTFNKKVSLGTVKINSEEIKSLFSTIDDTIFTATVNLSDGNKNLEVSAKDFANNQVTESTAFVVDANPATITLVKPKFGVSSTSVFDIQIETDNNALCKFSLDDDLEFEFMDPFAVTGSIIHKIPDFNLIATGDTKVHKLNVKCDDKNHGISSKSFDISVDASPPLLKSAFAFPDPVIEKPSTTTLTIEADEPVVCKFSDKTREIDAMENKFDGFDINNFKTINKQTITLENEGSYLYFVACKNKAELKSETKDISFKVDLTIPILIISHTPEYFNSTNVVLAIETNKKSQCKFSETNQTAQTGEVFGPAGYSHTRSLILPQGKHIFFITCKDQYLQKFSDVVSVAFTIDVTPPLILSVDDNSTIPDNPEFTFRTDSLRVKWNSIDEESGVKSHIYSLIEDGTSKVILNSTMSTINNEYIIVTKQNGTSLNLVNSNRYFFRVTAQNILGLWSNTSQSDGITVDTSLKPLNCTNGIKDEKESDVDCGSVCDLCGQGKACKSSSDCRTNFCNNGLCFAPSCDDNVKNQEESDADCGGSCKKCQNNKFCISNNDCESGSCSFGRCKPQESCADSKLSSGESDVDCGGPCPTKCNDGRHCDISEDCVESLKCVNSICKKCEENDANCNGMPDLEEQGDGTKDTDGDGLPDEWEIAHGLNPNDPNDANLDFDKDSLTNLEEYEVQNIYGKSTDPNSADTDQDRFADKNEIDKSTSPIDPEDFPKSNFTKTLFFVSGLAVLVLGLVYITYRAISRRKEEKLEIPEQRGMPKPILQQQFKKPAAPKTKEEEAKIRESLRKKEEQKEIERKKLFEAFEAKEKPKEEIKETREEKPQPKAVQKTTRKRKKADILSRLAKVAEGAKQKNRPKPVKAKERIAKVYKLARKPKAKK